MQIRQNKKYCKFGTGCGFSHSKTFQKEEFDKVTEKKVDVKL